VAGLPTGTVTFLFTDVEGSTRLLHELGDAYADVLAEHRRCLREAFTRHNGVEVDTQGDAFFVAFAKSTDALAAAAEGRDALAASPIRVRMGLHTGEPLLADEGYVGIDVHRAARIAAAGHGGQILVSQSTRELVGVDGLRDLGAHRLKDLTASERIYQLGDREFPPLKSLNQTNLPVQPTPLIGREDELREIHELLAEVQLLTLTGAGGSGKTRLALQAAADLAEAFADGVWFVPLATVTDPRLVEPTIEQVLGVRDGLAESLRGKRLLLLLDNLEQLLPDVAPIVASLNATVLATSRERLNLAAEQEYEVPTLPVHDAVALFTQRARQLKPSFEPDRHVVEIAQRLDGLPLALELAASRVKALTPEQIASRLGSALGLLTTGARDAPERQRTLRATIAWSYDLLDDPEKELFEQLAVFAGSFDLNAAEEVAGAELDPLEGLVQKSLLRQGHAGRFFTLATIHEYASSLFTPGPSALGRRRRHAAYYLKLAEQEDPLLRDGPDLAALDRMRQEHDNCRAALEFFLETQDAPSALRLVTALGYFWFVIGQLREANVWMGRALALSDESCKVERARALNAAAGVANHAGDIAAAGTYSEQALTVWLELGDRDGIIRSLNELGNVAAREERFEEAEAYFNQALPLARDSGDPLWVPLLQANTGDVMLRRGRVEGARALYADALEQADRYEYETVIIGALLGLALIELVESRTMSAVPFLQRALVIADELRFMECVGDCLHLAGVFAAAVQEGEDAAWFIGAADAVDESIGSSRDLQAFVRDLLATTREQVGDNFEEARRAGRSRTVEDAVSRALEYLAARHVVHLD
jgi:predicted ATPase